MNESPCEQAVPTPGQNLADRIIHELLHIARQWVVLRFLVDEELRQGGPVQLSGIGDQAFQRQAALFTVINELTFQGLIEWTAGDDGGHPGLIRPTPQGRHFVEHILECPHPGNIQRTIRDSYCTDLGQLLDLLEKVFHRLEP